MEPVVMDAGALVDEEAGAGVDLGAFEVTFCRAGAMRWGVVSDSVGLLTFALRAVPVVGPTSAGVVEWLVPAAA